ncbi:MAG: hypothetical protein LUQ06_06290 [Methylococcaceae bacterium]|nr:hypothetical protein [Methylococcaceae bacterium]
MNEQQIIDIVIAQRDYFNCSATRSYQARIECLRKLSNVFIQYEQDLHEALQKDLGKPEFEAFMAETGFCIHEITDTIRQLKRWMKPRRVWTALLTQCGLHY